MLAQIEDLLSWVLRVFKCSQIKVEVLIENVYFSAKFYLYRFRAILDHS